MIKELCDECDKEIRPGQRDTIRSVITGYNKNEYATNHYVFCSYECFKNSIVGGDPK